MHICCISPKAKSSEIFVSIAWHWKQGIAWFIVTIFDSVKFFKYIWRIISVLVNLGSVSFFFQSLSYTEYLNMTNMVNRGILIASLLGLVLISGEPPASPFNALAAVLQALDHCMSDHGNYWLCTLLLLYRMGSKNSVLWKTGLTNLFDFNRMFIMIIMSCMHICQNTNNSYKFTSLLTFNYYNQWWISRIRTLKM